MTQVRKKIFHSSA